jgi:hypothetical protein
MKPLIQFVEKNDQIFSKIEEQERRLNKGTKKMTKVKRRLVLVYETEDDEKFGLDLISRLSLQNSFTNFYKFNQMKEFSETYGFLCIGVTAEELFDHLKKPNDSELKIESIINKDALETSKKRIPYVENAENISKVLSLMKMKTVSFELLNKFLYNKKNISILFANSEFPLKIQKSGVFFGSRYTLNSVQQHSALNLHKFVEFYLIKEDPSKTEIIETKSGLQILKISVNPDKLIDFDSINEKIKEYRAQDENIIFIRDNANLAQGFLIAFCMDLEKKGLTMLSLRIFSVIGKADCEGRTYNQLMNFIPGQVKKLF